MNPEEAGQAVALLEEALVLLEEALFIRQHGERAPGGTENWRDWDRKAELYLRSRLSTPLEEQ